MSNESSENLESAVEQFTVSMRFWGKITVL